MRKGREQKRCGDECDGHEAEQVGDDAEAEGVGECVGAIAEGGAEKDAAIADAGEDCG